MYLARETIQGQPRYFIRESFQKGHRWESRDLFPLGPDPANWIHYPGETSYFIDESVEETLNAKGVFPSQEELEVIFWPFLTQDVRRVIERFHQQRSQDPFPRIPRSELARMQQGVHIFDKRRLHHLRYGRADPRKIDACPLRLYNRLLRKSRDEIEQMIENMENHLRPGDHKTYIYTVFYLQRHFSSPLAGRYPQAMDPEHMDEALLEEICKIHQDQDLFAGSTSTEPLHPSLVRYVIMYFDSEFRSFGGDSAYIEDFIHRHRAHHEPPPHHPRLSREEACRILDIPPKVYQGFSPRQLSRHYRKKAMECHPDQGGSHEQFIRVTKAYKALLARLVPERQGK